MYGQPVSNDEKAEKFEQGPFVYDRPSGAPLNIQIMVHPPTATATLHDAQKVDKEDKVKKPQIMNSLLRMNSKTIETGLIMPANASVPGLQWTPYASEVLTYPDAP